MHRSLRGLAAAAAFAIVAPAAAQSVTPLSPEGGPAAVPPAATPVQPGTPDRNPAAITTLPDRTFAISAQIGRSFGGTLTVENGRSTDWDVDPGLVVLARADFYVVQRFTMGFYAQLLRTSLPERNEDMGMNGYGLSLIGRFGAPDRFHARLGLLLGYQTNDFEPAALSGSRGAGIGALAEVSYPLGPSASLLAHISFITQADGGNSDYTVTFGPLWYLAIGAEFGR